MDFLSDPEVLARVQFALTAMYHFIFVPLSIGIGLIVVIFETRYFRSGRIEDATASRFWIKVFTATFALGVATGITMEFSFGTNWADYARFVGDIFGAPLAAEALFAFFLESVFLGVLLFGRGKVGRRFYLASAWLVWLGSCLSALWIIIANSWMQTPAGAEVSADGTQAVLTDFFAAAFNASTIPRYLHTVDALLIMGSFVALAIGAYYLLKKKHVDFAMKTVRVAAVCCIVTSVVMVVFAHSSAVVVAEEQPTKLAMMEGAYESGSMPLYLIGWVDESTGEVITPFAIEGGTSFLASGDFETEYPGLYELAISGFYGDDFTLETVENLPVGAVFQSYHIMVGMYALIMITSILALIFTFKGGGKIKEMRWLQRLAVISPIFPFVAIQAGWLVAELGRQPWAVYPAQSSPDGVSLLTGSAYSQSVSSGELLLTLVLFAAIYLFLFIAWARVIVHLIKTGPVLSRAELALVTDVETVGSCGDTANGAGSIATSDDGADIHSAAHDEVLAEVSASEAKGGE